MKSSLALQLADSLPPELGWGGGGYNFLQTSEKNTQSFIAL